MRQIVVKRDAAAIELYLIELLKPQDLEYSKQ